MLLQGGTVTLYSKFIDAAIIKRGSQNRDIKQELAETVADLVNEGGTVYTDSGSTNEEVLLKLINKPVTLVTSSSVLVLLPNKLMQPIA